MINKGLQELHRKYDQCSCQIEGGDTLSPSGCIALLTSLGGCKQCSSPTVARVVRSTQLKREHDPACRTYGLGAGSARSAINSPTPAGGPLCRRAGLRIDRLSRGGRSGSHPSEVIRQLRWPSCGWSVPQ